MFSFVSKYITNSGEEKLSIAEMTSRLNSDNVEFVPSPQGFNGYIQGDEKWQMNMVYKSERYTKIRDYFCYKSNIGHRFTILTSVKYIGVSAFEGCEYCSGMSFGAPVDNPKEDELKEIGDRAFFGLGRKCEMVYFAFNLGTKKNSPLERIGTSAFEGIRGTGSLKNWGMSVGTLARIESRAFADSDIARFHLGEVSDYIAPDIFSGCNHLAYVDLDFSESSHAATNFPWGADTSITEFHWSPYV